jgi:hypothetical protein
MVQRPLIDSVLNTIHGSVWMVQILSTKLETAKPLRARDRTLILTLNIVRARVINLSALKVERI